MNRYRAPWPLSGLPTILATLLFIVPSTLASEPLVHEDIIPAPRADVWKAFTTKEGIESWMVPHGDIDLRVGGKMRTTYDPNGRLGDENTIENTILSFEPGHMLSLKATKPPANFAFKDAIASTWSVMYLEEAGPNQTRLRIVGMGYGEDENSKKMREFFQAGNSWTINKLKGKFDKSDHTASDSADSGNDSHNASTQRPTWEQVRKLTGGEWIHESTNDQGKIFLVRNVLRRGPSDNAIVGIGWVGSTGGMQLHSQSQIWREPGSGRILFQNLNEQGGIATGEIVLHGDNNLVWDWNIRSRSDEHFHFQVNMIFDGDDKYRMQLHKMTEDGRLEQLTDLPFRRVDNARAKFKTPTAGSSREKNDS